eukprot:s191_g26.t1
MDLALPSALSREHWSGLLDFGDESLGPAMGRTMAHGQVFSHSLGEGMDSKVMVYDVRCSKTSTGFHLEMGPETTVIPIPHDETISFKHVKEVCAGLGCMGLAAESLGMQCLAAMDVNPTVVHHLKINGRPGALLGDVNVAADRGRLHLAAEAKRCILMSGFPCQPASRQGDNLGNLDSRAMAFHNTLRVSWEQQMSAVVLECVPGAADASYIQTALQKLCWSMGYDLQQRVLHLTNLWPSMRTRWWCMMTFRQYNMYTFPDLPCTGQGLKVGDLLPVWPAWNVEMESQVKLIAREIEVYEDIRMGSDQRHLRQDRAAPCILHSYGSVLDPCPCGCRSFPLSATRLARDGVRGFYVESQHDHLPRYLTTPEACLLLTVPPLTSFDSQKIGLALLGQCAAPVQGIWVLSHLLRMVGFDEINPEFNVGYWNMMILREFHSMVPFPVIDPCVSISLTPSDSTLETVQHGLRVQPGTQVLHLKEAETKMAGHGSKVMVGDTMGLLSLSALIQAQTVHGTYRVHLLPKRQCLPLSSEPVQVTIPVDHLQMKVEVKPGSFLFEAFMKLGIDVLPGSIVADDGSRWIGDERLLHSMEVIDYKLRTMGLRAAGRLDTVFGLGDSCLDDIARALLAGQVTHQVHWMPAIMATKWAQDGFDSQEYNHWLLSALHGHLITAFVHKSHWLLMDVCYTFEEALNTHMVSRLNWQAISRGSWPCRHPVFI